MSNVVSIFGQKKQTTNPLFGMDPDDVLEGLFDNEHNFELLGLAEIDVFVLAGCIEVFTDLRYRNRLLADIDNHVNRSDIRGLYEIDPRTFMLTRIADKPLKHFT